MDVVLTVVNAVRYEPRSEAAREAVKFDDFSIVGYVGLMTVCGLCASVIASILYMCSIRDELDD